jgi:hypothetical protein
MTEHTMTRRRFGAAIVAATGGAVLVGCGSSPSTSPATTAAPAASAKAVVYRTPTCGCCKSYEDYLRGRGYRVESKVQDDLSAIRSEHGIPDDAASCHTIVLDDYAVEGHVPTEAIDKLLKERPDVDAIALPGMPANSPGMGPPDGTPLEIVALKDGKSTPFISV